MILSYKRKFRLAQKESVSLARESIVYYNIPSEYAYPWSPGAPDMRKQKQFFTGHGKKKKKKRVRREFKAQNT